MWKGCLACMGGIRGMNISKNRSLTLLKHGNKNRHRFPLIFCLLNSVFIILGTNVFPFTILAAFSSVCFILLSSKGKTAGLLLFMLPFANVFKVAPGGHTFYNILVATTIIKEIFTGKIRLFNVQVLSMIFFIIYNLVFGGVASIVQLVKIVSYFSLLLILVDGKQNDFEAYLQYFSLGILVASIAGLLKGSIPGLSMFLQDVAFRSDLGERIFRFSGLYPNPNHYTLDISIALSGLFGLMLTKPRVTYMLYIITLSFFGILSLSKSFLLSCMVILFFVFIHLFRGSTNKKNIIVLTVFLFGAGIIVYNFAGEEISVLLARFELVSTQTTLSSLSSGRTKIFTEYLSHIFSEPKILFFGEGIGAGLDRVGVSAHNVYIEGLYYLGIFGCILYLFCLLAIFARVQGCKKNLFNYLPLVILLVRGTAASLLFADYFYMHLLIVVSAMGAVDVSEKHRKVRSCR